MTVCDCVCHLEGAPPHPDGRTCPHCGQIKATHPSELVRAEELIALGAAAIRKQEKYHRDNDLHPLLGYNNRADIAARIVVEAILEKLENHD